MNLPRGVWYERKKQRYRVRIVRDKIKVHESYHKCPYEAKETLEIFRGTADPKTPPLERIINQTKLYYKQNARKNTKRRRS